MTDATLPRVDVTPHWRLIQDHLLLIVDLLTEDQLDWEPQEGLWSSRRILVHVADARDRWLAMPHGVHDGDPYPDIRETARTKDDLKRELERTFARLHRFLENQSQLDLQKESDWRGVKATRSGHWIAFHLLEHDIHHRAELLQRLAMLDIKHGIDI